MLMVLSSWPKLLGEFTRFVWWMQTECPVAANPQTKPIDLWVCRYASEATAIHITIAVCYYYSARKLITHFTIPQFAEGWVNRDTAVNMCSSLHIAVLVIITQLPTVWLDPQFSHTIVRHATTRPQQPSYICSGEKFWDNRHRWLQAGCLSCYQNTASEGRTY